MKTAYLSYFDTTAVVLSLALPYLVSFFFSQEAPKKKVGDLVAQ